MKYFDIDYETIGDNTPRINLFAREDKEARKILRTDDFSPYIYEYNEDGEYDTFYGGKASKIELNHPKEVSNIKDSKEMTFEADVPFVRRFLIDKGIKDGFDIEDGEIIPTGRSDIPLRKLYLDIEILSQEGEDSLDTNDPTGEICLIGTYDSYTNNFESFTTTTQYESDEVNGYENEWRMLNGFMKRVKEINPDILVGFNSARFDMPYIINRCKKIGIDPDQLSPTRKAFVSSRGGRARVVGRPIFDIFRAYKDLIRKELERYTLDRCCEEEGVQIIDPRRDYREMHYNGELVDYNKNHCLAGVIGLDNKLNIFDFYDKLKATVGCRYKDIYHYSILHDILSLRKAKRDGIVLPNKTFDSGNFAGGEVYAESGVYDSVVDIDINSCYPSIIQTFNLSPETKVTDLSKYDRDELIEIGDVYFRKDEEGFLPELVNSLYSRRLELKKKLKENYSEELFLKQRVLKFLANAAYGVMTKEGFRLFDEDVAKSITKAGRDLLNFTKEVAEKQGYDVIYMDTDSVKVVHPKYKDMTIDEIEEDMNDLIEIINEAYDEFAGERGVDDHLLEIEYEEVFKRLFILTKKRYVGIKENDERKEVGLDTVRSDRSYLAKKVMQESVDWVLKGRDKEVENVFWQEKNKVDEYNPEKLAIPSRLGKRIDNYDSNSSHVKAARYSNEYLDTDISKGDRFYRLYVNSTPNGLPSTDVIAYVDDLDLSGFEIDYDRIINTQIVRNINKVLEPLNRKVTSVNKDQESLSRW